MSFFSCQTLSIKTLSFAALLFLAACGGGGGGDDSSEEAQATADILSLALKSCGQEGRELRIMPLGDSITESRTGQASYRYWLWNRLLDQSCRADFVGTRRGVSTGRKGGPERSPKFSDFDQEHQARWGLRTDEMLRDLLEVTETLLPDIVLVHLGTNDILQGQSIESVISDLEVVIQTLRVANPRARVILAKLIPANRSNGDITELNSQIPGIATRLSTADSPVIIVDQNSGFSVSSDTFDGIHPDESGERKMAEKWLAAILEFTLAP